ncbi:hypothetical protein, conserved [Eimeria tenella]|uniref:Uncharacterized protein n=1 Tax=Eimeria tenella TaxID=5802 RepID=U6L2I4_EIMTE|nr:hypothetical protein, conserved [Eimeria tenella]CDJ44602.1 hypothetical protein, conserved [Eimeria tenella]|eukprot:XP_013235350.1 hypothetical protein, conserved [Eimeria tenella]
MGLGGPPKGPGGSCGGPSGDPLGPPGEALQQEGPRGPSAGGPAAQGAPSPAQAEGEGYAEYLGGEPPGPPERGRVLGEGPPRGVPQGDPWEPAKGTPGGPRVGFVFCSAALLPLLIEALQQVHAVEAPKAAAAAAAAADAAAGKKAHYRTSMFADLHRSPPCLLPLLLLRFVLLPAAAAYGISAAVAALSSWARGYLHRGEPPAAAAAELHVPIDGDLLPQRRQRPRRGPPEGGPPRGPL